MTDPYGETRTVLADLPCRVKAFCFHDDEGNNVMVLNSRLAREQNRKSYGHEGEHIKNGDMYNMDYREYQGE